MSPTGVNQMSKSVVGRLAVAAATVLFGAVSIDLASTGGNSFYQVAVESFLETLRSR